LRNVFHSVGFFFISFLFFFWQLANHLKNYGDGSPDTWYTTCCNPYVVPADLAHVWLSFDAATAKEQSLLRDLSFLVGGKDAVKPLLLRVWDITQEGLKAMQPDTRRNALAHVLNRVYQGLWPDLSCFFPLSILHLYLAPTTKSNPTPPT
jgi:hypothetical protein